MLLYYYMYMANERGHYLVINWPNLVITWKIRSFVWFFNPLFWLYGLPLISYYVTVWFPLKRNSPLQLLRPLHNLKHRILQRYWNFHREPGWPEIFAIDDTYWSCSADANLPYKNKLIKLPEVSHLRGYFRLFSDIPYESGYKKIRFAIMRTK